MEKFFYKTLPFLPVRDIRETIQYYRDKLGFQDEWFWGDPPTDAGCHRNELSMLFNQNPEFNERIRGLELVMFVDDVDGVYSELRSKSGVEIASPIRDESWGIREFTVKDINGYLLRISCSLERISKQKNGTLKSSKK